MDHARLDPQRQQPATPGLGGTDLGRAPRGGQIGRGDHADHRVGPAQPLIQLLLPPLTYRDAILRITVQEHLVTSLDQPAVHLAGQGEVNVGVAEEDPGHYTSPASHPNRVGRRDLLHDTLSHIAPERPPILPIYRFMGTSGYLAVTGRRSGHIWSGSGGDPAKPASRRNERPQRAVTVAPVLFSLRWVSSSCREATNQVMEPAVRGAQPGRGHGGLAPARLAPRCDGGGGDGGSARATNCAGARRCRSP